MFKFDKWDCFQTEIAKELMKDLNNLIGSQKLPDIFKKFEVLKLSFGTIPPVVEVLEFSESPQMVSKSKKEEEEKKKKVKSSARTSSSSRSQKKKNTSLLGASLGGFSQNHSFGLLVSHLHFKENLEEFFPKDNVVDNKLECFNMEPAPTRICSVKRDEKKFLQRNNKTVTDNRVILDDYNKESFKDGVKIRILVSYKGDGSIKINTVYQMNYPYKNFAEIPVVLNVFMIDINFIFVITYTHEDDSIRFYIEEKGLRKEFSLSVEIGDRTVKDGEVYIDNDKIQNLLKKELENIITNEFVYPNKLRIKDVKKLLRENMKKEDSDLVFDGTYERLIMTMLGINFVE